MVKIPWERLKREGRSGLSPEGPSIQGRSAGEGAGGGMGPLSGGQVGPWPEDLDFTAGRS